MILLVHGINVRKFSYGCFLLGIFVKLSCQVINPNLILWPWLIYIITLTSYVMRLRFFPLQLRVVNGSQACVCDKRWLSSTVFPSEICRGLSTPESHLVYDLSWWMFFPSHSLGLSGSPLWVSSTMHLKIYALLSPRVSPLPPHNMPSPHMHTFWHLSCRVCDFLSWQPWDRLHVAARRTWNFKLRLAIMVLLLLLQHIFCQHLLYFF